ncbi:MAG: glycyl-radical enzyme activating protein [Oscillospiraceae bacterium]|nr:glycyl-radical enzyme activating protein [Oscillospiraceae bacterium]
MQGIVFNIQRHSIHDGPGIRSTVFLKGCSLRCLWCQNPESLDLSPQLQFYPQKCIGCGECRRVCQKGALRFENGGRIYETALCRRCGECAKACFADALILRGKAMTAGEVAAEIDKDRHYYESSGGGVTFSGGEPLLQADFLNSLLVHCKKNGYHTAVDTAGNVPWQAFEAVMAHVDLWLYDIKASGCGAHEKATGAKNGTILDNFRRLAAAANDIAVRVPVVPGINDGADEIEGIAGILSGIKNLRYVELLALNHMAEGKYASLGMDYPAKDRPVPSADYLLGLKKIFSAKGLAAK